MHQFPLDVTTEEPIGIDHPADAGDPEPLVGSWDGSGEDTLPVSEDACASTGS
ncbi:hypothetical protein [Halorubrum gandharaense]